MTWLADKGSLAHFCVTGGHKAIMRISCLSGLQIGSGADCQIESELLRIKKYSRSAYISCF